jgi:GNAT superfamily N-acetyltransferase
MLECFILPNLGHYGMSSAVIEDVAVRADCQGQGIGHQILHFALEQCKAAGCYKAVLSSSLRRERAHEFYEALGFERYGVCFAINPVTAD